MFYVYILRSESRSDQTYTGFTADLKKRLQQHNAGRSIHTHKYAPWKLETYVAFDSRERAESFESYLKSGSGRAFAARHLLRSR